jgi:hypothetical protein
MKNKISKILQKNFEKNISIPAIDSGNGSSGSFLMEPDIYMNIDLVDPRDCERVEMDKKLFVKVFEDLLISGEMSKDWEQWQILKGSGDNPYTITFWVKEIFKNVVVHYVQKI